MASSSMTTRFLPRFPPHRPNHDDFTSTRLNSTIVKVQRGTTLGDHGDSPHRSFFQPRGFPCPPFKIRRPAPPFLCPRFAPRSSPTSPRPSPPPPANSPTTPPANPPSPKTPCAPPPCLSSNPFPKS